MAVLMDYCMSNEDFVRIISASSRQVGEQCYYNHNKSLLALRRLQIGGKTGYTSPRALPCELPSGTGRGSYVSRCPTQTTGMTIASSTTGLFAVFRPQSAERRLIAGGTGDVRD